MGLRLHYEHNVHARPDWVIVGTTYGDQVMVIASDTLTSMELQARMEEMVPRDWGNILHTGTPYQLTGELRSVLVTFGDNYQEALAKLFGSWQPTGARWEQKAITKAEGT